MDSYGPIRDFLARVRMRQRSVRILAAVVRASVGAGAALLAGLALGGAADRSAIPLALIGAASLLAAMAAVVWAFWGLGRRPTDLQLARFIEERVPSFEDRLVTAVDFVAGHRLQSAEPAPLADLMLRDTAARVVQVDLNAVISADALRTAGLRAAAAGLALLVFVLFARVPARRVMDAASFVLVPSTVGISVRPGDVRIQAGAPVSIEARVTGIRAPIPVEVQIADGETWRAAVMRKTSADTHQLALEGITRPFRYRVVAGPLTSPTYAVTIASPPRVTRIDVVYTYPAPLGLASRSEQDGGDVYAPAGSEVRLSVHGDRPIASGRLTLARGEAIDLQVDEPTVLSARLKVAQDNSYRVSLTGADGLANPGDTEYFIRVLEDRPPEVHVTKPAGDRSVTRLQEVEIEAHADDDYGIDWLELVYAVRGSHEQAVVLDVPRRATSVTARHKLYLEDLDVQPGDFVSYYVRVRDLARGVHASEARSDVYFLDIRPFEQEFSLAQSQSMAGSGYTGAIDELVNAQRQVVVATWKLDRRAVDAKGARSEQDIRAVARTEADLKQRAERTASTFRESTMRDPRRRFTGGNAPPENARPEEDAMSAAVGAMDRAVMALEQLRTDAALPPEMDALNQLLRAQAEIKHRQVALNQAPGAAGTANRNFDISTLFDEELRRQQQTSYETSKPETRLQTKSDALEAIRDLARRQDELLRRQQDLARGRSSDAERKRQLEQLSREQLDLRRQAEELAQRTPGQQGQPSNEPNARLRDVSDDMRRAAGELRGGSSGEAGSSGRSALAKLRDLERQLQASGPDERRRELGEMRLEARQLADRQRQLASELGRLDGGDVRKDGIRRLAGEEERLLERMRRLEERVKEFSERASKRAVRSEDRLPRVALDLERQRLSERMKQSADRLRSEAAKPAGSAQAPAANGDLDGNAALQRDVAKELDRFADRLADASGIKDEASRRLSEQLDRATRMKEDLDRLGRALEGAGRQTGRAATDASPQTAPGEHGRTGEGRRGAGGTDVSKLSQESLRQLREVKELVDELRREDPSLSRNGVGFTLEGQGMILSAPGTEAFKQDFAKWDALRRQASLALEQAQSILSKKLAGQASKDRLPASVDEVAPPAYQRQVDNYFKALATRP